MAEEKKKNLTKIITPIFIAFLVLASFLGGSLATQLKFLGKGKNQPPTTEEAKAASPTVQQQAEGEAEGQPSVLDATNLALIEDSKTVKGKADAPVTIVEFSEYQCPYCKRYVDETYGKIMAEYGDKIRYIFRDYPLPFHQHAQKTAEAARCAGEQEKYWQYHDTLFANRDKWAEASEVTSLLEGYAQQLGLNQEEFKSCLSSGKFTQAVGDDFKLGQQVGVGGTPSFFVNGQMLVGAQPFESFKVIIDEELKK